MKKISVLAGLAVLAVAACKKDDSTSSKDRQGTWTVGGTVHSVRSGSLQRGSGILYAYDTAGSIQFIFPDTSVTAGTYTLVNYPTRGSKEMGIEINDRSYSNAYRTTGSDRVNAVVTVSGKAVTVTVPSCRIKRVSGSDSTTLSAAVGPLEVLF